MDILELLSAVCTGLCVGIIGLALARLPKSPIATPAYCFATSGVLWAVGDLIAASATGPGWKQIGVAIFYSGAIAMPALWWIMVLRWSEKVGADLPFRAPAWTRVPLLFAALMWGVMITNPWHGHFITPIVGGRNVYQAMWYVMALPCYGLVLASLAIELEVARRLSSREVRRQAAFLVAASAVTLIGNWVYVSDVVTLNLTPFMLSASGALLLVGMAREGLFGVLPVALPAIAAQHPDGIVVAGLEGNVRFANVRARELLAPVELAPEALLVDVLRDERLRPEAPALAEAEGKEAWWTVFLRLGSTSFRLHGGHARWLSVTANAVRGRRGGEKGVTLQIRDLTLQKQAELQLRQRRRLESVASVARNVSVELQRICSVMHGNAELLSQEALLPESERKVARIIDAAKSGVELAHDLQLYTGTFSTTRFMLDLAEISQETCELVEPHVPPQVRLIHQRAVEVLPVQVDALQIRHSIYNLLRNAIDAMADRAGDIEVTTGSCYAAPASLNLVCGGDQPDGEFAYVRIRDEGGGMDPGTEERAFEPFFSTHDKDRGTGLSTVLGVAKAHDALLALENGGDGCVFSLYFPLEGETERDADASR